MIYVSFILKNNKQQSKPTQLSHLAMGSNLLKRCTTDNTSKQDLIGWLQNPNIPDENYACQQNVKYQVPCAVGNILAENDQIRVGEHVERGKKFQNAYFLKQYEVYYTGEWKNGKPHGMGDIVFENGSLFRGIFIQGKVSKDDGILVMEDGSYYRGAFQNNAFNGYGKFVSRNKHTYEGLWQDNLPHGKGTQIYANGDTYIGQYVNGIKSGKGGLYTWFGHPQYANYKGQFNNNYMDGYGTLQKHDGTTIIGTFRQNNVEDVKIQNNEIECKGEIKNNILEGDGNCVPKQADQRKVYRGVFENGQLNGEGSVTVDGEEKNGRWFNGYFCEKQAHQYKGFTEQQIGRYLQMVDNQFQNNQYLQDAVEQINKNLSADELNRYRVSLVSNSQTENIMANYNKYGIMNFGEQNLVIVENKN